MGRVFAGRLLLLLCCLAAAGCGRETGQQAAGPALDLLTLSPPLLRPGSDLPPMPGPRSWDFKEGLPSGWRAGPEGVVVTRTGGGVILEHPNQPPWLELASELDPRLFREMWAELEPRHGEAAELYFSCSEPPDYGVNTRSVARFDDSAGAMQRCVFPFPGPRHFQGAVRLLRLYPGSWNGNALVRRVGLEPIGGGNLPRTIYTPPRISLQREFRRCWRLSGAGERTATFRVPGPDAEIHWSAGTLIGGGAGLLRLILETDGEAAVELQRTPFPVEGEGWEEHRAAIGRWAGREVTLRFQVEPSGPSSIRLIGSPRVLAPAPPARRGAAGGEHLLLIVVDALRADRLSLYGHRWNTSPHLARLAREGEMHTSAWSTSSESMAAMASLFTGCEPGHAGVSNGPRRVLPGYRVTIAERLFFDGCHTAAFTANPSPLLENGYARGFDTWYAAPAGQHRLRAGDMVQRALGWLLGHRNDRTFCLLQLHDTDSPYGAPAPEGADHDSSALFRLGQGNSWQEGNIRPLVLGRKQLAGARDRDRLRRRYDEEVAYTDRCIGRLLAVLEAEGLAERTTVVVTALNGEELGDRGFWGNGYSVHRESVRVPLIIRRPGHSKGAGSVSDVPVSLVDLMPTLLRAAGEERPMSGIHGTALPVPPEGRLLTARTTVEGPLRFAVLRWPYRYLFFDRSAPGAGSGSRHPGRWLMEHGPVEEALYRITDDPDERRNLIRELPGVAAELRAEAIRQLGPGGPADRLSQLPVGGGDGR